MKGHPTSYKDPSYDALDDAVTARLGLPEGLLASVRTKGERSNSDQVSSAGARTVYQVTPTTRKLVMNKYGIDPYLSPENASEAAGLLLKEGLQRNGGDPKAAVAEYIGGTNRDNHGPQTRAYVARVTGGAAPAGQSTYDRVKAKTAQDDTPSIAKVYDAYKAGKLDPQAKAEFEKDVNEGAIMLPRGAKIDVAPTAHILPKGVVAAYNSHSEMTEAERAQVDQDLASGVIALPKGTTLNRPAARTAGEMVGMGARNVVEGAGGLVDIVAGPANALVNTVAGTNLSTSPTRDLAAAGADALGLATPGTNQEKLAGSLIEGGTQGLLTAGAGGAIAGLEGAPGLVGRELAVNPITDTIASGTATGGQEVARQNDAGPVGQLAAALVGGVTGVGMAKGLEAAAAKFGPKAAKIVETIPREVMLDEKGALTDEGREVATRAGLKPEDVQGTYDEFDAATKPPPGVPADDAIGQQYFSTMPKASVGAHGVDPTAALKAAGIDDVKITGHDPALGPVMEGLDWPKARDALTALRDGDAQGVLHNPATGPVDVIYGNEAGGLAHIAAKHPNVLGDDFADQFAKMQVQEVTPGRVILRSDDQKAVVALNYDGQRKRWLLTAYDLEGKGRPSEGTPGSPQGLRDRAAQSPGRPTEDIIAPNGEIPKDAPADAAGRAAEAQSEGVSLTKGQAEKDFATQEREQTLSASDSPEGTQVRQHFEKQGQQITSAVERFKSGFGDTSLGATERGQVVKEAVRDLRDNGKAGVSALYKQAQDLAEGLGENASNLTHLDTAPILDKMREIQVDRVIPVPVRDALRDEMARYGLIGQPAKTVEGMSTVKLLDDEGKAAETIRFRGPQERLTIANAEELRKTVNDLFRQDTSGRSQALKPLIDDAVEAAVERAASQGVGEVGQAFKAARAAHKTQQQTFKAKDVVEKIIGWKKGTQTDELKAEDVIKTVLQGGPEGVTNLRKLKAVLLSNPTEKSRNAWRAVQAHGVADIFKAALSPDDKVSGLRLNTAIKKFGPDKLKILLPPEDFNQLMKLRRVIGDATIPLPKTTNPSGSGYAVIRFLSNAAQQLAPVGRMVPMVRDVVKGAEEFAVTKTTKATAQGVTDFKPANANAAPKPKVDPAAWARKFINLAGSDQILAPLMAAAANEERP